MKGWNESSNMTRLGEWLSEKIHWGGDSKSSNMTLKDLSKDLGIKLVSFGTNLEGLPTVFFLESCLQNVNFNLYIPIYISKLYRQYCL